MKKSRLLIFRFACIFFLVFSRASWATSISGLYIFGDSLSATNSEGVGASNGDLWPAYLAPDLGLTYNYQTNFAFLGALSTHLTDQITYHLNNGGIDPNGLYVVWAGGNDILNAGAFSGAGATAAGNVITAVSTLASAGATKFLVPTLGDLGYTPSGNVDLTGESQDFRNTIFSEYAGSDTVTVVDLFSWHHDVRGDPSAFGLTNVDDACSDTLPENCGTYLYYDNNHPTTKGHSLIADEFSASLVPIPAAAWLFGSGLLGLIGIARSKAA